MEKDEYTYYLQSLFVASYIKKASPTRSIEDELEAIAVNKGQDKEQAKNDVRQILNLKKAFTKLLRKIVEEKFSSLTTNKD